MHNMGVCEIKTREGFHLAMALNHTAVVTGMQGSQGLFGPFLASCASPHLCNIKERER
tara:strand:+ start:417 stop:590 length:174 start_codon:yes stop_codon:yes gene_type:complete